MATRKTGKNASLTQRLKELQDEAATFEQLADDAAKVGDYGAAVTATAQLASTRNTIADIEAALASDGVPEQERLATLADRASAAGSWVAASKMLDLCYQAAERDRMATTNAALRAAAVAPGATEVDFYRAVLAELFQMQATETGIAKIQALKAAEKTNEKLTAAIKAAESQGEMSDAEIRQSIEDQIPDIPDEHLAIYVRGYCERHGLPMPHRVAVGGRVN